MYFPFVNKYCQAKMTGGLLNTATTFQEVPKKNKNKKQNNKEIKPQLTKIQPTPRKSSLKYLLERPVIPRFQLEFDLDSVIQIRYLAQSAF